MGLLASLIFIFPILLLLVLLCYPAVELGRIVLSPLLYRRFPDYSNKGFATVHSFGGESSLFILSNFLKPYCSWPYRLFVLPFGGETGVYELRFAISESAYRNAQCHVSVTRYVGGSFAICTLGGKRYRRWSAQSPDEAADRVIEGLTHSLSGREALSLMGADNLSWRDDILRHLTCFCSNRRFR